MIEVTMEHKTVEQVIDASHEGGHVNPLRQIKLHQLLAAQPNFSPRRALRIIQTLIDLLERNDNPREVTLGWLVDTRSHGRRLAAWKDLFTPRPIPDGFPWSCPQSFPCPVPLALR